MKTKLLVFIVLLTGALLYQAPARLILLFSSSLPIPISAHQIHGSLWRGEINNITITLASGNYPIKKLQWKLNFLKLLQLKTSMAIEAISAEGQFTAHLHYLGGEAFQLEQGRLILPAKQLQPWFDYGRVSGEIIAKNINVAFEPGQLRSFNADVLWRQAKLQVFGYDWGLGDLSFTLLEQQGEIHINNSDNSQSVLLQAQIKNPNQASAKILGTLSFNANNPRVGTVRQLLPEPLAKKMLRKHLLNFSLTH